jgi:hypothetical protein
MTIEERLLAIRKQVTLRVGKDDFTLDVKYAGNRGHAF